MTTPNSPPCIGDPKIAALRVGGMTRRRHGAALLTLLLPALVYLASIWVVWPVPLAYVTPFLMLLGPLAIKVPRRKFAESLGRLRLEFSLLFVICLLSVLSLAHSDEPFRAFRIIYPCVLPALLVGHLIAVGSVSRAWLLAIPQALIIMGALLSLAPFLASLFVPPLKALMFDTYRLKCFFENPIQHAIALAVLVPLIVTEIVIRKGSLVRGALISALLLFAYALFSSGSKTAMLLSFSSGLLLYGTIKVRSQSALKSFTMGLVMAIVLALLWLFGLDIATKINPTIGEKLRQIAEGGIANYQSIDSRELLWGEAMKMGKEHWMIGSGAGVRVLGVAHAHNLVLDYFKGIGLFGAAAISMLCLLILGRTCLKGAAVLKGLGDDNDKRILATYVAASLYVLLNQMSDCFGPSTIGFLWVVYLSGVLAERTPMFSGSRRLTTGARAPTDPQPR